MFLPALRKWSLLGLFLLIALPLGSCKKGFRTTKGAPLLSADQETLVAKEIDWVTAGSVGTRGPVEVHFLHPWASDQELSKPVDPSLLEITPSLKGALRWKDNQTLVFDATEDLEEGTLYTATLDLPELTGDARFPAYPFSFSTPPQSLDLKPTGLRKDPDGTWSLSFSAVFAKAPVDDPGKLLSARQSGGSPVLSYAAGSLRVSGLARNGQELSIQTRSGAFSQDREWTHRIPAEDSFDVLSTSDFLEDGMEGFEVVFGDALGALADVEGLVAVEGSDVKPHLEVDGSRLRASWTAQGKKATLVLKKGLPGAQGLRLASDREFVSRFKDFKPFARFVEQGAILPSSSKDRIHFETMNLGAVRIRVLRLRPEKIPDQIENRYLAGYLQLGEVVFDRQVQLAGRKNQRLRTELDLGPALVKSGPGLYSVELTRVRRGMLYPCTDEPQANGAENADDEEYGWNWRDRDNPCKPSYWSDWADGGRQFRNLLSSDLGLMAWREPDGRILSIATDLVAGGPWKGAKVELLDKQDAMVASGSTDGDGALFLDKGTKASLVRATASRDGRDHLAYLGLSEGSVRNLSKFDVDGRADEDGIRLFLYSERGVYRPGDSLYLGCVLRGGDGRPVEKLPVRLSLRDPLGRTVASTVLKSAVDGHFAWRTATRKADPTGRWTFFAEAGPVQQSRGLLVETVRPNRLKVELTAPGPVLNTGEGSEMSLASRWLSGGSAAGLSAKVELAFENASIAGPGLRGYSFTNPVGGHNAPPSERTAWEGTLNGEGMASFRVGLPSKSETGSLLRGIFRTRVFEPGGEASLQRTSVLVSPYKRYAGVRLTTDQGFGWASAGSKVQLEAVLANARGAAQKGKLQVSVYQNPEWWWWEEGDRTSGFVSRRETRLIETFAMDAGASRMLDFDKPGRYLVMVQDPDGGHQAGTFANVWGSEYDDDETGGSRRKVPALLAVRAVRDTVSPGQSLEVRFPGSKDGKALVQVMRGRRILSQEWVSTKAPETVWKGDVTSEMEPGVYVQVTVLQPYPAPTDRPLRLWGVVPVLVVDPASRLEPVITSAGSWQPATTQTVHLSERSGKEMQTWLAVVDEGLLDLTGFETPDPWSTFHARAALSIQGWDLYDEVSDSYSGRIDRLFTVGGDGDVRLKDGDAKTNPFAPMVVVRGPFKVPKGGLDVQIPVPRYTGSVRLMAVSSSGTAYGRAEKAVPVRSPVMVLGTAPRALSPGDEATIPVSVFSDRKGNVAVRLETKGPVRIVGSATTTASFTAAGEQLVEFRVRADGATGNAVFALHATAAHGKADQDLSMPVRLPGEPTTRTEEGTVRPGASWTGGLAPFGLVPTRTARLELSGTGVLGIENRIGELVRYPHGCLEQTVSAAFPQLFLRKLLPEASEARLRESEANVDAGLSKLSRFQTASGAFSLWPGEMRPYEWGTLWAARLLILAKGQGHAVPAGVLDRVLAHLAEASARWVPGAYATADDTLAQVQRLDLLALSGKPELALMNRLRVANLPELARWVLAAAYATAGRSDAAQELAKSANAALPVAPRMLGGWLHSPVRDQALLLEAMLRAGATDAKTEATFQEVRRNLSDGNVWLSTQEAGSALWAVSRWLDGAGVSKGVDAQWRLAGGAWTAAKSEKGTLSIPLPAGNDVAVEVRAASNAPVQALVVRTAVEDPSQATPQANGLALSVEYRRTNGGAVDPAKLAQGEDFLVVATVTNVSDRRLENLALVQVFPGGWELRNENLEGAAQAPGAKTPTTFAALVRAEMRDDRTMHYLTLERGANVRVVVGARAAYAGIYARPGAQVSAMYDARIAATTVGGTARVDAKK